MYDAIVLAGGAARRLGGAAKPQLDVGGASLLDRVLDAAQDARGIVVVGPEQPVGRDVAWAREAPPGGGPVAALAAGLPLTTAQIVVTLAADLPWIAPAVAHLVAAVPADGLAQLVDRDGRANHLAAAWRRSSLTGALAALGDPNGASMRRLVGRAAVVVPVPDVVGWGRDCDTWDDLAAARDEAGGHTMTDRLEEWTEQVCGALGLDPGVVDRALVLDLARDVAHGVARPAAPLTAFLVGLAAGRDGADADSIRSAAQTVTSMALAAGERGADDSG